MTEHLVAVKRFEEGLRDDAKRSGFVEESVPGSTLTRLVKWNETAMLDYSLAADQPYVANVILQEGGLIEVLVLEQLERTGIPATKKPCSARTQERFGLDAYYEILDVESLYE